MGGGVWGSSGHTGDFSRKIRSIRENEMALMNLFAGQEWRHRCREWICGHIRGKEGGMN